MEPLDLAKQIQIQMEQLIDLLMPIEVVQPVTTSDELTAALLKGGDITLAPGEYKGSFKISQDNTTINGNSSTLHAPNGYDALEILMGVKNTAVKHLILMSDDIQRVVMMGRNDDKQNTLDLVPDNVYFENVNIPTFRGKTGFEINASHVTLKDCSVRDCWNSVTGDSKAIAISNTPGPVSILGGYYEAGSEIILSGGDVIKIPGLIGPSNILIDGPELARPASWQTDGVNRNVKNIIELKNARHAIIRNVKGHGCWAASQDGYAVVLTPHSGGVVVDVLVENNEFYDCAAGINILGNEYAGLNRIPSPEPASALVIRNNNFKISSKLFGGPGLFCLMSGQPHDVTLDGNTVECDGSNTITVDYSGSVLALDGTKLPVGPIDTLAITRNKIPLGIYGIKLGGAYINGVGDYTKAVTNLTVTENTFSNAKSTLKTAFPNNTYV